MQERHSQRQRCTPSYTDQIFSRPIFTDKTWSQKYCKLIASFAKFLQWLHLNNYLAWQYLAWFYKRGKRRLCKKGYLDVAIAKNLPKLAINLQYLCNHFCKTAYKQQSQKYLVSFSWFLQHQIVAQVTRVEVRCGKKCFIIFSPFDNSREASSEATRFFPTFLLLTFSLTKLGNLLDFGPLFKAFGNN